MDEDMGQYRLAWSEFSRCGELARDLRKAGKNPMAPYFVAQADERIATAAQELGLLPQALQALDEDQVIIDRMLVAEPHNPKLHRFRALIDHYRSEIYFAEGSANLGNPGMALQSAKQYLARTEEMVRSDPNNASAKLSRAIATLQISFCLRESDAHAALDKAREALHLFDDLIASGDKSYLVTSRRVSALIHVAAAHLKANQITDAVQASESALAATQALTSKETPESHEHVMLFSALTLAGNANALAHNFERAETLFRGAREQAQSMAKGQELEDLVPMADAEAGLGKFYASRRQLPEARDCFEKLNALWNRFAEPNVYVDKRKAEARELLASIAK
jgi:tetratricopeptide (TPR) repeat protein